MKKKNKNTEPVNKKNLINKKKLRTIKQHMNSMDRRNINNIDDYIVESNNIIDDLLTIKSNTIYNSALNNWHASTNIFPLTDIKRNNILIESNWRL